MESLAPIGYEGIIFFPLRCASGSRRYSDERFIYVWFIAGNSTFSRRFLEVRICPRVMRRFDMHRKPVKRALFYGQELQ